MWNACESVIDLQILIKVLIALTGSAVQGCGGDEPLRTVAFSCGNACESVIDLQILIKVLIAFDWFGSARVRREMSPSVLWCNFEGQHIRGKDIVVIEFVSFSNSFGKSMILR